MNELLIQVIIDESQVRESQELRHTISGREIKTVCQHGLDIARACGVTNDNASPPISPVSSSSEYCTVFEGEDAASHNEEEIGHIEGERSQEDINVALAITGTSLQATVTSADKPGYPAWNVYNSNTVASLNLNLVHKLSLEGRTKVAFSMDGKYLATASSLGIVSIFDSKTGEIIMHR